MILFVQCMFGDLTECEQVEHALTSLHQLVCTRACRAPALFCLPLGFMYSLFFSLSPDSKLQNRLGNVAFLDSVFFDGTPVTFLMGPHIAVNFQNVLTPGRPDVGYVFLTSCTGFRVGHPPPW